MNSALRYGQTCTRALPPRVPFDHVKHTRSAVRGIQLQSCARPRLPLIPVPTFARRCCVTTQTVLTQGCTRGRVDSFIASRFLFLPTSLGTKKRVLSTARPRDIETRSTEEGKETRWNTRLVDIPIGGSGFVSLDIFTSEHTLVEGSQVQSGSRDVLIYLPRGPSPAGQEHASDDQVLTILLDNLLLAENLQPHENAPTIVRLNYRLAPAPGPGSESQDFRFPTPIHDVSVALNWILKNREAIGCTETTQSYDVMTLLNEQEPRVSIFGSNIGASLALMLALTQPNEIHSVAVHDPITDWVGLDELVESNSAPVQIGSKRRVKADLERARHKTNRSATALIDLRTRLFRTPSGFFDAFASPLMFLRAPGRDTPLWKTAAPEVGGMVSDSEQIADALRAASGVEISEAEMKDLIVERGYGPYDDDWYTAEPHIDLQPDGGSGKTVSDIEVHHDQNLEIGQITTDLSTLSVNGEDSGSHSVQCQTDLPPTQPQTSSPTSRGYLDYDVDQPFHDGSYEQLPADLSNSVTPRSEQVSEQGPIITDLTISTSSSTRRRKVLRRWPPNGRPEDVDLPYVKIYSTVPNTSASSPEAGQDVEMAYVLHPQAKEMADVMTRACFWGREKSLGEERVELEEVDVERDVNESGVVEDEHSVVKKALAWFRQVNQIEK